MKPTYIIQGSHSHIMAKGILSGKFTGTPRQNAEKYLSSVYQRDNNGRFCSLDVLKYIHHKLFFNLLRTAIALEWGTVRVI